MSIRLTIFIILAVYFLYFLYIIYTEFYGHSCKINNLVVLVTILDAIWSPVFISS